MSFFRSTLLRRILFCLLLVLLSAGPFGFVEKQGDKVDDQVISSPYSFGKLNGHFRQIQIKYGFDVIYVSLVPTYNRIVSETYITGTSFDPLSADFFTYPDRGPPHHTTLL